jgi:putative membrane protein
MDANAEATLEKIKSAAKGAAFDKEYIKAQIANHEFLRDLAAGYIKNSTGKTAMPEVHGRHLAMLTLGQFKDHVVLTKDVMQMLG